MPEAPLPPSTLSGVLASALEAHPTLAGRTALLCGVEAADAALALLERATEGAHTRAGRVTREGKLRLATLAEARACVWALRELVTT